MEYYARLSVLTLVIICIIGQDKVNGLRCHKCSSILDLDCGNTWELEGDEGNKYVVDCPSGTTACQKIVGEIQGNFDQHVYRQCWDKGSNLQEYTPIGCEEDEIRGGVVCRCKTDACNGQQHLVATISTIVFALFCHKL